MNEFQVMPPLSGEEYAELRADVGRRGVLVPVVVDQYGRTLDGHHRRAIAAELGIDCPTEVRNVTDDTDARDIAYRLNLARRQLNREQKQRLIIEELRRDPNRSDRAIGRLLGVDGKTVGSMRQAIEEALREQAEAEERERQRREDEDVEALIARVKTASRPELDVWAYWVVAHDGKLGDTVLKHGVMPLSGAAAQVRRRFGCVDLGCEHAPPIELPEVESAEIPHLPDWKTLDQLGPYMIYPLRRLLPLMNDHYDWCRFVASVRDDGLIYPIVLTHDRTTLVDGRLRYLACEVTGVEPRFETLPEDHTDEQITDYIGRTERWRTDLRPDQVAVAVALVEQMRDGGGRP